jgi:hypothetical protein
MWSRNKAKINLKLKLASWLPRHPATHWCQCCGSSATFAHIMYTVHTWFGNQAHIHLHNIYTHECQEDSRRYLKKKQADVHGCHAFSCWPCPSKIKDEDASSSSARRRLHPTPMEISMPLGSAGLLSRRPYSLGGGDYELRPAYSAHVASLFPTVVGYAFQILQRQIYINADHALFIRFEQSLPPVWWIQWLWWKKQEKKVNPKKYKELCRED